MQLGSGVATGWRSHGELGGRVPPRVPNPTRS